MPTPRRVLRAGNLRATSRLAEGLHCIAVATPFTEDRLCTVSPLDKRWIVSNPDQLLDTVDVLLEGEDS